MINLNYFNTYYFIIRKSKAPEIAYQSICDSTVFAGINKSFDNVMQLLGLIVLFFVILFGSVFITRWIGLHGMNLNQSKNFTIIESFTIAQNKCIQIIKVADKYIAIAVSKENIEFLCELDENKIDLEAKNKGLNMGKLSSIFNLNKKTSEKEHKKKSFKEILKDVSKGKDDKHE